MQDGRGLRYNLVVVTAADRAAATYAAWGTNPSGPRISRAEGFSAEDTFFASCAPSIRRYEKSRWRKPSACLGSSLPRPHLARPRRLCQPPWTQPSRIGDRPTSQAEPPPKKRPNSNASRSSGERGLGGEALLSEKRPLPPASPYPSSLGEGARWRGLLYREVPSIASLHYSLQSNGQERRLGGFSGRRR